MEASSNDEGQKPCGYLSRQSSARWIPTGDQIRILRDLYYNYGVRSPSAEQIQRISSKLRQYGKIEGKNVFYWFQNHKARERQKKRLTGDVSNAGASVCRASSASVHENGRSLLHERSFKGGCFFGGGGGDGTGTGFEQGFPVMPWACEYGAIGDQQEAVGARTLETLPLFPTAAEGEEEDTCVGAAAAALSNDVYWDAGFLHEGGNAYCQRCRGDGGGGGCASLELTLNSYHHEPPRSMN
ncbi:hypothetical protein HPP92_025855 [Vanilla planifolia]|uniref:Homeobox domain-containing protein n=1 Tax=Vanilla planifolia TaxID=51239 RepID=A0A835UBF4_VANPL|nr:hypothetical protein HPP92_025855 [Vanilla planifolia]